MIRILHVVTYMGRGGLETMLMNYYRHIDREQVQFDFLVHRAFRADFDDEIEALGGRIHRLPRLVPWSPGYLQALNRFFEEHPEYRIVHVHQDCLSAVILKAAKQHGVPVRIAHAHSSNQDKNLLYPIKLFYKRFIPKYATELFACGMEAGDWMFGGVPYRILNNAVPVKKNLFDPAVRREVREEQGLEDAFVVGLVGRFSPAKNHMYLLEIFRALLQREPAARLLLVGDGNLREEIQGRIREYGMENRVILTGVRTDTHRMLQAMDAFVMPSNYEGLSLASVEAQAAGLPCFISDRVPIECKKTDLVKQIPLTAAPEVWAAEIEKCKGLPRHNTYSEIAAAGFDIEENARQLQKYYLEKIQ